MHALYGRAYVDPSAAIKNILRGDKVLIEGKFCDLTTIGNWRLNHIAELVKSRAIRPVAFIDKKEEVSK